VAEKLDPRDPRSWIPRDVFAEYVGPQSDDLLAYYDKAVSQKNPLIMSFSPLAVFLLPAWLGLRQQWAMWATFTGMIGILPFIENAVGIAIPNAAFVGIGLVMGLRARGLLLTTANAQYTKLKRQGLAVGAIRDKMRDRARLNIPFALAGCVGSVMVVFGLAHLAALLSGRPFP
jgi:hypothetical protein